MKRLTIRIDDLNYSKLSFLSDEKNESINKVINEIIEEYLINQECGLVNLETYLKSIESKLEQIYLRQNLHFNVSLQEFANRCYSTNVNINEDKCLKEILDRKDKFNG